MFLMKIANLVKEGSLDTMYGRYAGDDGRSDGGGDCKIAW